MTKQQNTPPGLAVVTGASSGLGAEFARQLAADGHDVLLIARRTDRLERLAAEIAAKHGVRAHTLTLDLANEDSAERIEAEVARLGRPLRWLVNNAGYGLIGRLDAFSAEDHRRFVRVLGVTPIETCLRLLPILRQAAPSHIINVASLAAFMPGVYGAGLYPGVKAMLLRFGETLATEELRNGVTVTTSCPGLTETEIFDHQEGGADAAFRRLKPMSPIVVVDQAIRAAKAGRIDIIHGTLNRTAASVFRHMPPTMVRKLTNRVFGLG